jgi:pimeloyl-ACP methyl ester carboxylesterase
MYQFRRGYADTSLGQVHYYEHGRSVAGRPDLLLIHQSPQSGNMFEAVIPALAAGRRVVAMDTVGYGMSDRPKSPLEPEDYARAIADLAAALGMARFHIVGVHTGAVFAIETALAWPDRVPGIVLSGPPMHPPRGPGQTPRQPTMKLPPAAREDGTHLTELWQQRWKVAAPIDPAIFQKRFLNSLIAGDSALSAYHAVYKYDLTERLKLLRCPALIVYGDRDVETPNIIRSLPHVECIPTRVIPGGNIYTVDLRPADWSAAVLEFLGG